MAEPAASRAAAGAGDGRIHIQCIRCEREVLARLEWVGREVECPHCYSLLRVPAPQGQTVTRAQAPSLGPRAVFNFPCPRCGCLLEAHTGMSGYAGRCPGCGVRFLVPRLRWPSGSPRRARLLEGQAELPGPVHAYASDGQGAPRILRRPDGTQFIECRRCRSANPVDADNCGACGAAFTLDGAATLGTLRGERRARAALVLAILGLLTFPLAVPAALAVGLGARNLVDPAGPQRGASSGVAVALGILSLLLAAGFWYRALS